MPLSLDVMFPFKLFCMLGFTALIASTSATQAQSEPLDISILGIWSLKIHSEYLAEIGRGQENPGDVSAEIEFKNNGYFEVRIIDSPAYSASDVKYLKGSYVLEKGILKMSVIPCIWDKHSTEITNDSMYWHTSSQGRELTNKFTRAEEWSIE